MSQSQPASAAAPANAPRKVLFASFIGTTIEFFDFYIYATAAVLVFPQLFFPSSDPTSATLQSFATFAIAFFARPFGGAVFGHYGDRIGRKATLVAALMTMGLSTIAIGLLPTYAQVGVLAPLLLALCRFGQGLGLGGEWGGAILLATENAPPHKRAWYGMFPQLGAPIGFLLSTGSFLLLDEWLDDAQFLAWGWRLPFLASALLVFVGLYVRLTLHETPAFQAAMARNQRVAVPLATLVAGHGWRLMAGTLGALVTFLLFYIMTVFTLSWATSHLGYTRGSFLPLQMAGVVAFAVTIPLSAALADRYGRRPVLLAAALAIIGFGIVLPVLFVPGSDAGMVAFLALGFACMGLTYAPLGTALSELFPTAIRYTGASAAFNISGILGASLTPFLATGLAATYGLSAVGWYIAAGAALSLLGLLALPSPKEVADEAEPQGGGAAALPSKA